MLAQVAELAAQKAEQIRHIESLSGDDLVRFYCTDIIGEAESQSVPVTLNGEPLARGAYAQPIVPGMNTARV
jgi:hypothetical protein